jgi:hypothetical protein
VYTTKNGGKINGLSGGLLPPGTGRGARGQEGAYVGGGGEHHFDVVTAVDEKGGVGLKFAIYSNNRNITFRSTCQNIFLFSSTSIHVMCLLHDGFKFVSGGHVALVFDNVVEIGYF